MKKKLVYLLFMFFSFINLSASASPEGRPLCTVTGSTQVCANQLQQYQVDLNNTAYTYQWVITGGSLLSQTGNSCTVQWGTSGTGTALVNVSQNGTLISTCSLSVTIYALPTPSITPSFETKCNEDPDPGNEIVGHIRTREKGDDPCSGVCEHSTVVYTTPNHPGNTYSWQISGLSYTGTSGQGTNSFTVDWGTVSSGTIQVTETNPAGCTNTVFKCIKVVQAPIAAFSTTPSDGGTGTLTICKDQVVTFKDLSTATGGSAIYSWTWDFGDGTGTATYTAGATVTHQYDTYNGGIPYKATLTVKNVCGCENTFLLYILVKKFSVPTLACLSTVCCNKATKYSINHAPDEAPGCGYLWSVTGGVLSLPASNQVSDNAVIVWNCNATPKTITLTPVNCNGCAQPIVYQIPVISQFAAISGSTIVCPGSEVTYNIPPMPGCNFTWSLSDPTAGDIFAGALTNSIKIRWSTTYTGTVTLYVNYENTVFGCKGGGQLSITLRPSFQITDNPSNAVCPGNPVTFTATDQNNVAVNCSWQINLLPSGTTVLNVPGPVNAITYTFTAGGDYEIVATDNSGSTCNSPVKFYRTITPTPPQHTGTVNGQFTNLCPGQNYLYTATPSSSDYILAWNASPGGTVTPANGNKVNIVWTTAGTIRIFQVTKTNPACSSLVRTIAVTMMPPPPCGITGNTNACPNGTFAYGAAPGYSYYTWTVLPASAGSIISGQGTANITVQWHNNTIASIANISVAIKYCGTAVQNCGPLFINITSTPTINITPANGTICQNNSQNFTLTGISSAASVAWNWGDGTTTNTTGVLNAAHSYSTIGTFNITAAVTTPNGCTGAISNTNTTVNVNAKPVVSISIGGTGKTILCPGDPPNSQAATFFASVQGGNCTGLSYQWRKNGTNIPTATNSSYNPLTWPPLGGVDTYTVAVTCGGSPCGIIVSPSVNLTSPTSCIPIPPCTPTGPPNTSLSWNQTPLTACGSGNFVYSAPAPGLAAKIDFGDGIIQALPPNNGGTVPKTYTRAGIYNAIFYSTYPSTSLGLCTVLTPLTVTIPVIANTTLSGICSAGNNPTTPYNIILTDISDILGTYSLSPTTLRTCKLDANLPVTMPVNSNSFTFNNVASGVHTVVFTITVTGPSAPTPYSCSITQTITLATVGVPPITIGPNIPRCVGAPVQFSTSNTNIAGYVWQFGDATSSLLAAPTHEYKVAASPATISLTVTTNQGCVASNTATLNVVPNNMGVLITSPSGTSPVNICQGSAGPTLNAVVTSGVAPLAYSWNSGLLNNISTAASIIAGNQQSDGYTVTVVDNIGCLRNSNPFNVVVIPTPVANISGRSEYCYGEVISLSADQGAGYTYQWTVNGFPYSTGPVISLSSYNYPPGNITIGLTVTAGGCSSSTSIVIQVNTTPFVTVTPGFNSQLCAGQPNLISASVSGGTPPYSYYWNTVPTQTNSSITVSVAGLYKATVIDAKGCQGEDMTRVYRVEDFTNFMSGCYELCNDNKITLVGPKSPSIPNGNVPYTIVYNYQWFKDGNPIPPPDGIGADLIVDPNPGPYSGPGQYTLTVQSTLPSAGCDKNSLTDYQKSFNVTFNECCKTELSILNIKCYKLDNGLQSYIVTMNVYNPYSGPATVNLFSPNGQLYTIPATFNLPNPGINTVTFYFTNSGLVNGKICIIGGTIFENDGGFTCNFDADLCADLPPCDSGPCIGGNCSSGCIGRNVTPKLTCSQEPPIPGYQYTYGFSLTFDWVCRSTVRVAISSPCGVFGPLTPDIISDGTHTITGFFYSNEPPGTLCNFNVTFTDPGTGEVVCNFCFTYTLPCFRSPVNTFSKTVTANNASSNTVNKVTNSQEVKKQQSKAPEMNNHFVAVPNPAGNYTTIYYTFKNSGNNWIVIYDLFGKLVKTYTGLASKGSLQIDTSAMPAGTYLVKGTGQKEMMITKLIIAR
jgi:hypothetical protein